MKPYLVVAYVGSGDDPLDPPDMPDHMKPIGLLKDAVALADAYFNLLLARYPDAWNEIGVGVWSATIHNARTTALDNANVSSAHYFRGRPWMEE
jgi:hypothetical protein